MERDSEASLFYTKNYDKCLFFIRHGEKKDKGKGAHINGSITDKGIEQAHKSGIFLAKSIKNHPNFNIKTDGVVI